MSTRTNQSARRLGVVLVALAEGLGLQRQWQLGLGQLQLLARNELRVAELAQAPQAAGELLVFDGAAPEVDGIEHVKHDAARLLGSLEGSHVGEVLDGFHGLLLVSIDGGVEVGHDDLSVDKDVALRREAGVDALADRQLVEVEAAVHQVGVAAVREEHGADSVGLLACPVVVLEQRRERGSRQRVGQRAGERGPAGIRCRASVCID